MKIAREQHSVVLLNGYIHVAGGFTTGNCKTTSAELYDPRIDRWVRLANMNISRSDFALFEFNEFLYAMGGSNAAERYDPWKNCWTIVGELYSKR